MPSYEIWFTDDVGRRLAPLDDVLNCQLTRVDNGIGRSEWQLPGDFPQSLLKRDRMIQFWRGPRGGTPSLFRTYFVRKWRYIRIGSDLVLFIWGPDVNDLMKSRGVINYADTAGSAKTDFADDMMKEIVDEQAVTDTSAPVSAFGARAIPNLSVQADAGLGPTLSMNFSWRNLADVLTDISKASRAEGNEVFWDVADIIAPGAISFQFRTKTGQPGADLTSSVVFDEERGNLKEASLTLDYSQEITYVYGLGQGRGTARNVQQQWDAARISASQFNRREGQAPASFASSDNAVREAARERLTDGLGRQIFQGRAIDTRGTRFGVDWNWGDKVRARFLGLEFDAIIRKLTLTIDGNGHETIDARIESEDVLS